MYYHKINRVELGSNIKSESITCFKSQNKT